MAGILGAGIGFESSVLTYFGSLAQDIHHIVGGKANPHGPVVYVLTGTSLAFCALAATVATIYTKCAFASLQEQGFRGTVVLHCAWARLQHSHK